MSQSPNRLVGAVFGIVYLLVGVAGFFVTTASRSPPRPASR